MNLFNAMIAYEQGELEEQGVLELFQALVNNGMAWTLQGHYGRMATHLLDEGLIRFSEDEDSETSLAASVV